MGREIPKLGRSTRAVFMETRGRVWTQREGTAASQEKQREPDGKAGDNLACGFRGAETKGFVRAPHPGLLPPQQQTIGVSTFLFFR